MRGQVARHGKEPSSATTPQATSQLALPRRLNTRCTGQSSQEQGSCRTSLSVWSPGTPSLSKNCSFPGAPTPMISPICKLGQAELLQHAAGSRTIQLACAAPVTPTKAEVRHIDMQAALNEASCTPLPPPCAGARRRAAPTRPPPRAAQSSHRVPHPRTQWSSPARFQRRPPAADKFNRNLARVVVCLEKKGRYPAVGEPVRILQTPECWWDSPLLAGLGQTGSCWLLKWSLVTASREFSCAHVRCPRPFLPPHLAAFTLPPL